MLWLRHAIRRQDRCGHSPARRPEQPAAEPSHSADRLERRADASLEIPLRSISYPGRLRDEVPTPTLNSIAEASSRMRSGQRRRALVLEATVFECCLALRFAPALARWNVSHRLRSARLPVTPRGRIPFRAAHWAAAMHGLRPRTGAYLTDGVVVRKIRGRPRALHRASTPRAGTSAARTRVCLVARDPRRPSHASRARAFRPAGREVLCPQPALDLRERSWTHAPRSSGPPDTRGHRSERAAPNTKRSDGGTLAPASSASMAYAQRHAVCGWRR